MRAATVPDGDWHDAGVQLLRADSCTVIVLLAEPKVEMHSVVLFESSAGSDANIHRERPCGTIAHE